MCYSKELSLKSFLVGLITSILLIHFGNKDKQKSNLFIGLFFIFVSLMQLVEYSLWNDINCNTGENTFVSKLAPVLNHMQPIIFILLASYLLSSKNIIRNNVVLLLNIIYIVYCIYKYYNYILTKESNCTGTNSDNHLDWPWKYDFNYTYYHLILFINLINYTNNIDVIVSMIISYALLMLSIFKFNKNIGEFWCMMVTAVPLIIFIKQIIIY
jgi:hypothetical protein